MKNKDLVLSVEIWNMRIRQLSIFKKRSLWRFMEIPSRQVCLLTTSSWHFLSFLIQEYDIHVYIHVYTHIHTHIYEHICSYNLPLHIYILYKYYIFYNLNYTTHNVGIPRNKIKKKMQLPNTFHIIHIWYMMICSYLDWLIEYLVRMCFLDYSIRVTHSLWILWIPRGNAIICLNFPS